MAHMVVESVDLVMTPGDSTFRLELVSKIMDPDLLTDRLGDRLLVFTWSSLIFCAHCYLNAIRVYVDVLKYEAAA
jgi:hypothetical protein